MAKIDIFAPQDTSMISSLAGQKIMIYGDSDTGKTFQATRMEKPMLLMAESGGSARNVPKFPINNWDSFTEIVKQLTTDITKTREMFQTIVIDTVEELVSRCEEKVAKRYGVTEVGMVQQAAKGNPNGYSVARAMFKQQINQLTGVGLTVVFISHNQEIEYTDPLTGETYNKFVPYGSEKEKGSTRFVRNLCDFVIYTQAMGLDPETGKTIYSKALCKETKRAFARSRYTQMQTYIEKFTAESLVEAIEEAIRKEAENEGAGLVEFKKIDEDFTKDDYISMIQPYFKRLHKLYPDYVLSVVAEHLGEGRRVSSATDDEVTELGNIYSDFVQFACERGIVVED